jgi:VanZ family protein
MRFSTPIFILLILLQISFAHGNGIGTDSLKKAAVSKHIIAGAGISTVYISGLAALNQVWYKNEQAASFKFHNDLRDWNQMDKAGHFWTAFHLSRLSSQGLSLAGTSHSRAAITGSVAGFLLLAPIEIFDGYSPTYGASVSDLAANAAGSAFFAWQELLWKEIRIMPKFSYRSSQYPQLRPETFGKNFAEQLLKDYNGQTYWLSFNISSFTATSGKFPQWLNLALGYGSTGMLYGNPKQNSAAMYVSQRRLYVSPDIDFSKLRTKSKLLKTAFHLVNAFKIPLPAIELTGSKGIKTHLIMY